MTASDFYETDHKILMEKHETYFEQLLWKLDLIQSLINRITRKVTELTYMTRYHPLVLLSALSGISRLRLTSGTETSNRLQFLAPRKAKPNYTNCLAIKSEKQTLGGISQLWFTRITSVAKCNTATLYILNLSQIWGSTITMGNNIEL
jgi:hypothetical protein